MAAPLTAAVSRGLRWVLRAASAGPPSRRAGGAAGAGREPRSGGDRGLGDVRAGRAEPRGLGKGRAVAVRWEEGAVSVSGRFRRFYTVSAILLESCARCSGSGSALGHILGLPGERPSPALGRHPPPVATSREKQARMVQGRPDQPPEPKVLRIAIIGAPNAGKSTLSNQLLGRKVFPVSKKVHTTRCKARGVITHEDTQLIILDTPGLTCPMKAKRHKLEAAMLTDPWDSMKHADLVLVLVDVSDHWTRNSLSLEVLKCLSQFPQIPSVLVLNKVDLLKKKFILLGLINELTEGILNGKKLKVRSEFEHNSSSPAKTVLKVTQTPPPENRAQESLCQLETDKAQEGSSLDNSSTMKASESSPVTEAEGQKAYKYGDLKNRKGWPHFQDIFMLAALNGEEVDTLKQYLLMQAKPGPWEFHSRVLTSQSPHEICDNIIRAKILEYLPLEVPYGVTQVTELWEEGPSGELVIVQNLVVPRKSHKLMLIGRRGAVISRIAQEAGQDLMNIFLCDIRLKLKVEVKS